MGKHLESNLVPRAQSLLDWLREEKIRLENLEREVNHDKDKVENQLNKEHTRYNKLASQYSETSAEME